MNDVTMMASFAQAERNLVVRLPRWIVGAASAVQPDNAARIHRELEAGFLAVANGRLAGNPFLTEIATGTLEELRAGRSGESLEDIFLALTGGAEEAELADALM
jgi:hypothetical protein